MLCYTCCPPRVASFTLYRIRAAVFPQALAGGAEVPGKGAQRRLHVLVASLTQQAGSTRRKRANALFRAVAAAVGEKGQDRIPLQAMEAAILPGASVLDSATHGDAQQRDTDTEAQRKAVQRLRNALVRAAARPPCRAGLPLTVCNALATQPTADGESLSREQFSDLLLQGRGVLDAWVPGGRSAVGPGRGGGSARSVTRATGGEHKRSASGTGRRKLAQGRSRDSHRAHSSRSLGEDRHRSGGSGKHAAEGGAAAATVSGDLLTRAMAAGAEAIGVEERDLRHALQFRAREVASSMLQDVGITDEVMEGAGAYLDEVSGDAARGPAAQARESARQSVCGLVSAIVAAVVGSGCLITLNLVRRPVALWGGALWWYALTHLPSFQPPGGTGRAVQGWVERRREAAPRRWHQRRRGGAVQPHRALPDAGAWAMRACQGATFPAHCGRPHSTIPCRHHAQCELWKRPEVPGAEQDVAELEDGEFRERVRPNHPLAVVARSSPSSSPLLPPYPQRGLQRVFVGLRDFGVRRQLFTHVVLARGTLWTAAPHTKNTASAEAARIVHAMLAPGEGVLSAQGQDVEAGSALAHGGDGQLPVPSCGVVLPTMGAAAPAGEVAQWLVEKGASSAHDPATPALTLFPHRILLRPCRGGSYLPGGAAPRGGIAAPRDAGADVAARILPGACRAAGRARVGGGGVQIDPRSRQPVAARAVGRAVRRGAAYAGVSTRWA